MKGSGPRRSGVLRTSWGIALALAVLAPRGAGAQEGSGYDAQQLSARGFVAVDDAQAEQIPGGPLMLGAYIVFAGLLGGYVALLARRHSAVQAELRALRRAVEDLDDRLRPPSR